MGKPFTVNINRFDPYKAFRFLVFFISPTPELPPSGASPIAACVDAHPHQPWAPHHEFRLIHVLKLLIDLQENLLGDLFGVVVIGQ